MRWLHHLSIRSKLLAILLLVAGCSTVAVAVSAYRTSTDALTDAIFSQLTSLRASRTRQIETLVRQIRGDVTLLGETPTVASAVTEFIGAWQSLPAGPPMSEQRGELADYYRKIFLPELAKAFRGDPIADNFLPNTRAGYWLQKAFLVENPNKAGEKDQLGGLPAFPEAPAAEPPAGAAVEKPDTAADAEKPGWPEGLRTYGEIHAARHEYFRRLVEENGYYDLFLIDPDSGAIVYSVFKTVDLGTSLKTGPYSGSGLAEAFTEANRSTETGVAFLTDFSRYRPSYGQPAGFVAAPVFDGARKVGVVAVQMPLDDVDRVMTGNRNWKAEGLGDKGEVYLVGDDNLMRSNSRFVLENPEAYLEQLKANGADPLTVDRVVASRSTILAQSVDTEATELALAGKQGTRVIRDYRDEPVLSSFGPLTIPGVDWVILAEKDMSEAYAPIRKLRRDAIVWTVAMVGLVTLLSLVFSHLFTRPIRKLMRATERIERGDTAFSVRIRGTDEYAKLGAAFNKMLAGIIEQKRIIEEQNGENERLLLNILPEPIAHRLQEGETTIADSFADVSVLFAELVGFGKLNARIDSKDSVKLLNEIIAAIDEVTGDHGVEKIRTIGESYLAVCGLNVPRLDHVRRVVDCALDLKQTIARFNAERETALQLRIGVNCGPVTAGVVGRKQFLYDLWGDTVTIASEMRTRGEPEAITVTDAVHKEVHDLYEMRRAGEITVPGKGTLKTWRVLGPVQAAAAPAEGQPTTPEATP